MLNCPLGGSNLDIRKVFEDGAGGKIVIAVAVGDVYSGEIFIGAEDTFDPF